MKMTNSMNLFSDFGTLPLEKAVNIVMMNLENDTSPSFPPNLIQLSEDSWLYARF